MRKLKTLEDVSYRDASLLLRLKNVLLQHVFRYRATVHLAFCL